MKILKKSITNSIAYSSISLVYSFLLIYVGMVEDSIEQGFPMVYLKTIGIFMLLISAIVGIIIVSIVQNYDEYQMKIFMNKIIINWSILILFILCALILIVCFLINSNSVLLGIMVLHWIVLSVTEIMFLNQIKR